MSQEKITENCYNKSLGGRLRNAREKKGWSQGRLAKEAGIKRGAATISEWERGIYTPSMDSISKICRTLGIDIDQLTGGEPGVKESIIPHEIKEPATPWAIEDVLSMAHRVLTSGTSYADALHVNIVHFDRALDAEERAKAMEQQQQLQSEDLSLIKDELNRLKSQLQIMKNENSELKKEASSGKNIAETRTPQSPTSRKTE